MLPDQQKNIIGTTKAIYILLMLSTLIGISGLIAVVMAYIYKDGSPSWLQTHYQYQIRTFWIGLLYAVIGLFTYGIGIGVLLIFFTVIWMVIRCIKGLKQLDRAQPVSNPESWLFD